MMPIRVFALSFFALCFSAWLGRAELHTDDTGILVALIAAGGFVLSVLEPRRPWVWGLIVPAGIIAVNLWRHPRGAWSIAAFAVTVCCAAAYAGALVRRQTSGARMR